MAEVVAAFGVPHTPYFPALVAKEGPDCETAKLFAEVRRHLEQIKPDVIVVFDSDHLNTFFLNHLPTLAVGVAKTVSGPNDQTPMLPRYVVPIEGVFASHLRTVGINQGFDLSLAQDFEVDHSILVPLHFLTPGMSIPIVPIFINGIAPPIPAARRCFTLGQMVRTAIAQWPASWRVAVLASGSFSLDVGGPPMDHGSIFGVPDPDWTVAIQEYMRQGKVDDLLNAATSERMLKAGNVGGELLNWVAMLGTIGNRTPRFLEQQLSLGHAYGVWRWD